MKKTRVWPALLAALVILAGCAAAPPEESDPPTEEFVFTRENMPRLNGSTSAVPLAEAVCSVLLGESREEVADLVQFSRTTASYEALMAGEADLLLAGEPEQAVVDTYAAGAEGLILYGPEGCCWLGTDGTVQGEWPWEELVAVPEMAAEVMNWERLMFEPAWRDDLVWMGWTDESRSRNRLLDLSLGRVREEEPGEWRAIQDTWLVGRGEGYTYFDGEDTFDGSCTRLEIGGQICEIPYGGTELYCTLKRGLLFFNDSSSRQSSPSGAVYRLDGMPVVEAGTYTSISLVRDEMGEEGPVLLMGERTDGSCDLLDEDGALWMEDVPSYTYPYLTGEILQLEEKVSGRQVVSCYDTRTGELLYRRTLGLGDDQQEPLEDW